MLKQVKPKDTTLDEMSEEDDFSDLGVLDDSNSMYMVSFTLVSLTARVSPSPQQHCADV